MDWETWRAQRSYRIVHDPKYLGVETPYGVDVETQDSSFFKRRGWMRCWNQKFPTKNEAAAWIAEAMALDRMQSRVVRVVSPS